MSSLSFLFPSLPLFLTLTYATHPNLPCVAKRIDRLLTENASSSDDISLDLSFSSMNEFFFSFIFFLHGFFEIFDILGNTDLCFLNSILLCILIASFFMIVVVCWQNGPVLRSINFQLRSHSFTNYRIFEFEWKVIKKCDCKFIMFVTYLSYSRYSLWSVNHIFHMNLSYMIVVDSVIK